jgi:3-deoxy-D-manno-octulosonic-acid transferase
MLRTGKWRTDWAGRFGHVPPRHRAAASGKEKRPTILIHAVSLGEVNATRQLVQELEGKMAATEGGPDVRIVITTTTNTGFARATELYGKRHAVLRYPLDFTRCVRRFLDAVRPDVVALVELEIWPTFVEQCAARGIPVCVINGRLSERSFKRYRLIRPFVRRSFASLAAAAVQTVDYAERFKAMGAAEECVSVTDSMKWDTAQVTNPATIKGVKELATAMGINRDKPVIVAGSTGPGEERMLIETKPPGVQLILVPRKPERFEEVAGAIAEATAQAMVVRRSQRPDGSTRLVDGTELFLLDTMGELRKAYAICDVAIVGRSFIDLYGSDPIEPIALGRATIIGPRYGDFREIVDTFRAEDGIIVGDKPCETAAALLADHDRARELAVNGQRVILSRQGATRRHVELILELLSHPAATSHAADVHD